MAREKRGPLGFLIDALSSYWLAAGLLFFLFWLTLFGTLAQVDHGIYLAQKKYFESWFVLHEQPVGSFTLVIPLLGGMTCMTLLAVNLVLGGMVRMRLNKSTLGVFVIHIGIALMLAAALVKQKASEDGYLRLFEGEAADEFVHFHDWEVAVFDAAQQTQVEEWLVPHSWIADLVDGRTRTVEFPDQGFELEFSNFVVNGRVMPKGPNWSSEYPTVDGYAVMERPFDAEAAERNVACLFVTAHPAGGEPQQGLLYGFERYPWTFEANGKRWAVSLRHRRMQMPFRIALDEFTRELHPRTGIPKVFSSEVTQTDLESKKSRKIDISMNEPLRSGGLVLFQSSWGPPDAGPGDALFSQFSVVRNPSDSWPLWSCIVITIGLVMAFGQKLMRYVKRQNAERAKVLAKEPA